MENVASSNPLAGIMPVGLWLQEQAVTVFPTPKTWEYFRQTHRDELVKEGVLLLGSGRRSDYVDGVRMGHVVRDILVRESVARLQEVTAHA